MTTYEVQVTLTNEHRGYHFAEFSETVEGYTRGEIYRMMQREYGRCTSSVYVDTDRGTKKTGWYFVSRQRYEDTNEPYLRGAWITLRELDE